MTLSLRFLPLVFCVLLAGCGYHLAGARMNAGRGKTLAVPVFTNRTPAYRLEQHLTEAVRREFIRRTHYRVLPGRDGDVVLSGEVLSFSAIPIIFNPQGRGSIYSIAVDLKVQAVDAHTGKLVFQNERWTFREVFELAQTSQDFVLEDFAAVDRLARTFAAALVASVLNQQP